MGIEELKPIYDQRSESDETYDDNGAMREATTGYGWRLEVKLKYSTNAAGTAINTTHAGLRNAFLASSRTNVAAGEFGVRWYDRNGVTGDDHEGLAYVKSWGPEGGNGGALDTVTLIIQGQGTLSDITNPVANLDPVVATVSPVGGGTAGGTLVQIFGHNFTGTTGVTGVKFGATNATSYVVNNDALITAVAPAHAAGSVQVIVTTPEGASADVAGDNFLYA